MKTRLKIATVLSSFSDFVLKSLIRQRVLQKAHKYPKAWLTSAR